MTVPSYIGSTLTAVCILLVVAPPISSGVCTHFALCLFRLAWDVCAAGQQCSEVGMRVL